jgi:hypothetical protein
MNLFEHLASLIIRPNRHDYRLSSLGKSSKYNIGPVSLEVNSKQRQSVLHVTREDKTIRNRNGHKLYFSHYTMAIENNTQIPPTVFYLHANNGSRVEGIIESSSQD